MRRRRFPGFTLVEMVVVVAIVVALAGILVPIVTHELTGAKESSAMATCERIAGAIGAYMKDTGFAPTGANGRQEFHFLHGDGVMPEGNVFASGIGAPLSSFLTENPARSEAWHGPYLQKIPADPWGGAYLVNAHGFFRGSERVWVISAGPNRRIDTGVNAAAPEGDDIAVFVQ